MNEGQVCQVVIRETREVCSKPAVKEVDFKADASTHQKLYQCGSSVVRVPVCLWHAARFSEDKQATELW